MEKLSSLLALSIALVSLDSSAEFLPYNKHWVTTPNFYSGVSVGLAGMNWRPSLQQLDYAFLDTAPSLSDIEGSHYSVDPEDFWGYRVYLSFAFPTNNEVLVSFSDYHQSSKDEIATDIPFALSSAFFFGTSDNLSITGFPITFANSFTTTVTLSVPITKASMKPRFRYQAWDVELAQHINVGQRLSMRWFGGLRYASLNQTLNAFYNGTNSTILPVSDSEGIVIGIVAPVRVDSNLSLTQKSDYHGMGPRLGSYFNFDLFSHFSLAGETSAALLIGESNSSYNDLYRHIVSSELVSLATGESILGSGIIALDDSIFTFRYPDQTRIVPNLEAKLGLNYSYLLCNHSHTRLTIEGGWMATHYFNSFDRLSAVDAAQPELRTRHTLDTSFYGPYLDVRVRI